MEIDNVSQLLVTNITDPCLTSSALELPTDLITAQQRLVADLMLSCGLCVPLAVIGILGNVVNLVVLAKQGLWDSVNVSLGVLAFCDLTYVIIVLYFASVCTSYLIDPLLFENTRQTYVPHAAMLRIAMARISSGVMALISAQRCLCVIMPLQVRSLVTYKCTTVALVTICVVVTALFVPVLLMLEVKWFPAEGNRTIAYAVPTEFYAQNELLLSQFSDLVISVLLPFLQVGLVIVCTFLTVVRLKVSSGWRQSVSKATAVPSRPCASGPAFHPRSEVRPTDAASPRADVSSKIAVDEKTAKLTYMLITIAVIYIICATPGIIATLVRLFIPEFNLNHRYNNTFFLVYDVDFALQTFNSSVTFFVYMIMSERFRTIFLTMLHVECLYKKTGANCSTRKAVQSQDTVLTSLTTL